MRNVFCKTRAGLIAFASVAVLGMALTLSGCPIVADNRNTYMGGPGDIFGGTGQQPTSQVTVTISGIPAENNGRDATVTLSDLDDSNAYLTGYAIVAGGSITVTWQNVVFPRDYRISVSIDGGSPRPFEREIIPGDNPVISWEQ